MCRAVTLIYLDVLCLYNVSFIMIGFVLFTYSDIYFIGGFGTVAWVDVKEYEALQPDKIAVDGGEQNLKVCHLAHLSFQEWSVNISFLFCYIPNSAFS